MKSSKHDEKQYQKRRKWVNGISIIIFVIIILLLTLLFMQTLAPYLKSAKDLRQLLDAYGWKGRFVLLGLQCVQVVVALIPGEIIELGAGYAYGALEGTILCLIGIGISSALVFLLTKKFGIPMTEMFISREQIQKLRFINTSRKRKRLVFLLFLIPGTPKDVLTYFVGLTEMSLSQFLTISLIARIPSIVSSTISGHFLGEQNYVTAGIIYAVTGLLSIAGFCVYNTVTGQDKQVDKE